MRGFELTAVPFTAPAGPILSFSSAADAGQKRQTGHQIGAPGGVRSKNLEESWKRKPSRRERAATTQPVRPERILLFGVLTWGEAMNGME